MRKEKYIYILLFAAIFSAVLRISQESSLTLFRILLPFSLLLIRSINKRVFSSFLKFSLLFIFIACLQNLLVQTILYPNVKLISWTHLFSFCIHYISIFIVVALVYCIKIYNRDTYFLKVINYGSKLIKVIIVIYMAYILAGHEPTSFKMFGNINDFGCILTGGILIFLFDVNSKYRYLYITLILIILLYNDSKLALFGSVLEILLYLIYKLSKKFLYLKKVLLFIFIVVGVFLAFIFVNSSIVINGYSVSDLILLPFKQIVDGVYFPNSSESYTYRANCIIGITEILGDSNAIGIGPGNTSIVLKTLIPDPEGKFDDFTISSHIWWYEIMADLGWLIIVPMVIFYIKQCRGFLTLKSSREKLFTEIYIITFPLWSMSSSGLYTEFFSIILLSFSIIVYRQSIEVIKRK